MQHSAGQTCSPEPSQLHRHQDGEGSLRSLEYMTPSCQDPRRTPRPRRTPSRVKPAFSRSPRCSATLPTSVVASSRLTNVTEKRYSPSRTCPRCRARPRCSGSSRTPTLKHPPRWAEPPAGLQTTIPANVPSGRATTRSESSSPRYPSRSHRRRCSCGLRNPLHSNGSLSAGSLTMRPAPTGRSPRPGEGGRRRHS